MITLIQLSDCHLLKDKDKAAYAGIAPYHSLARVLSDVQKYVGNSADIKNQKLHDAAGGIEQEAKQNKHQKIIVLVTGDISGDNSAESYQLFASLMHQCIERANIEWFVLAGNHDNNPYFEKYVGNRHLKSSKPISLSNWQIHGLDTRATDDKYTAAGEVKENELKAIKQSLEKSAQIHHLIALHHHILPSNSWMDKHFLSNAQRVVTLTEEHPQIKALIHGHVHSPLRQKIGANNTPSYGSPSTCWQWEMQSEFGVSNEASGYQVVNLMDDGSVDVVVNRVEL